MTQKIPVSVALVVGLALSLLAHAAARDWEEALMQNRFEREVIVQAANLRQEIALTIEAVHSIRALYNASMDVKRDEFKAFAMVEMEEGHYGIQALEWIPRVAAADRAVFEAAARADGLAGFSFTERESPGQMVAAAVRDEYFPVFFVEPMAGNEAAMGFDLGSSSVRLAALNKARDSGKTVATARIKLVQETGDQYGFLVFEPIYRRKAPTDTVEQRRAALHGFGLGVLRIGDIVNAALTHDASTTVFMDMFVFDTEAPTGQRLLYPKSAPFEDRADIGIADCTDTPLRVGGRDWLLVNCPADGAATVGRWQSRVVLIVGLLLSGTLTLYLRLILREKNRTELMAEGLRASEERYRGLFDNAHDMIQSVDAEGRFIFVNQAWTKAMGYTLGDLANVYMFDLIAPELRDHCQGTFKEIMAGKSQDNIPVTFIRKDGRPLETEGNIAPQYSAGRIVATQGIFRDVTERNLLLARDRVTQIELQQIADELSQLIDTANAPIFGIDLHGQINEWNQRAASITGFTKDDVMGRDLVADFTTDNYKVSVKAVLNKALAGEETANFEFPLFTKSGARVIILLNSTTRRNVEGAITGVIGIGQDITDRRRIEVELIQAAKLATLGEMSTGVAHELNQPLNVIRMAADSTLERISAQTERAAAIIDHMRIFGRKVDEKLRPVDLREVARDALGLMGEQLRIAGIEVETDFPEACRLLSGHAVQLEQVVLNLLGNARYAIEASRQGAGEPRKITLTVEDTGPEDRVRLIIEDSGGGIPEDIISRIFEPFFTTKEIGQGTGLGLSISYGIVSDMGGTIEAANAGDGARITISLPVAA